MYARMSRIAGLPPDRLEQAAEYFEREELPALENQQGFKGVVVMVDRTQGRAVALTYWESLDDLQASDRVADKAREATMERAKATDPTREPVVERYEVLVEAGRG